MTGRLSDDALDRVRRNAGVTDPAWTPPPAPEDVWGQSSHDWRNWPTWVMTAGGYPIGSRWRLTRAMQIVCPLDCLVTTLALVKDAEDGDRYRVMVGTTLTLVESYDPEEDPALAEVTGANWTFYCDGWATKTYRIDDGPSAGIAITLPADPQGGRFPYSALLAHAALVPLA